MAPYDPKTHHRHSIRAKGYDYSLPGAYFLTVCVANKACLFGSIIDETMQTNAAGRMVEMWWLELGSKYPHVCPDTIVVMPNHIHGIVTLEEREQGAHAGAPLPMIVQWFKTMTTNDYIRGVRRSQWPEFHERLWQRNYYEHVIRDEAELNRIREYVTYNPLRWALDQENPECTPNTKLRADC